MPSWVAFWLRDQMWFKQKNMLNVPSQTQIMLHFILETKMKQEVNLFSITPFSSTLRNNDTNNSNAFWVYFCSILQLCSLFTLASLSKVINKNHNEFSKYKHMTEKEFSNHYTCQSGSHINVSLQRSAAQSAAQSSQFCVSYTPSCVLTTALFSSSLISRCVSEINPWSILAVVCLITYFFSRKLLNCHMDSQALYAVPW